MIKVPDMHVISRGIVTGESDLGHAWFPSHIIFRHLHHCEGTSVTIVLYLVLMLYSEPIKRHLICEMTKLVH